MLNGMKEGWLMTWMDEISAQKDQRDLCRLELVPYLLRASGMVFYSFYDILKSNFISQFFHLLHLHCIKH